jgi:hypothetical protein
MNGLSYATIIELAKLLAPCFRGRAIARHVPSVRSAAAGLGLLAETTHRTQCRKYSVNKTFAPIIAASVLLFAQGCATQSKPASTKWEYQEVTSAVEARQMAEKGWVMAGFSKYTDATGRPQSKYIMKRPKE